MTDRAALAARLTELAARDFCRAGAWSDPRGGEDISGDLEQAAALLAAPERTWENTSNATVQHLPTFGTHEGTLGVSCSCGAWIPEDGWRDAQRRWWAHVTSAVLSAVIAWRREDISAGKLAEVLGLSPTTHEMRDLQFVYNTAPERETPHPLALLTSREPEVYATLKNHLAHAPLCTATGESYAVRDYCLLDGERAKCDCGLAALLARLAGGDRG